jgi:hypothetical protein
LSYHREGGGTNSVAHRLQISVRFFVGRPFGRRESFESRVRNPLAALDRAAVRPVDETGLGTFDGGEFLTEIISEPFVEFVLKEVGCLAGRIVLRRLARVPVPEPRERPLDPQALSGQQFASTLRVHQATLAKQYSLRHRANHPEEGMASKKEGWNDRRDRTNTSELPMIDYEQ